MFGLEIVGRFAPAWAPSPGVDPRPQGAWERRRTRRTVRRCQAATAFCLLATGKPRAGESCGPVGLRVTFVLSVASLSAGVRATGID